MIKTTSAQLFTKMTISWDWERFTSFKAPMNKQTKIEVTLKFFHAVWQRIKVALK